MDRGTFTVYVDYDSMDEFLELKNNSDYLTMEIVNSVLGDHCNSPFKQVMLETMCKFVEHCFITRPDTNMYVKIQLPIHLIEVFYKIKENYTTIKKLF